MSVPGIVQSRLDGERVAARVALKGENTLYVTPTRTLIYREDGLLSDESVEEYPHDAERIEVSEGRRKSAVGLDYGIEGDEEFKVPTKRLSEALSPVLAGVLNAADVTAPDETVRQTYRFSELTLVVTSERVVKHVGAAVWDEDHEQFHFDDVTALDVEEGNVSSQIIIESEGRPQRIKTPSDRTREVRERIERALLEHHGLNSYEEFARERADPEDRADAERDAETAAEADAPEEADPLTTGGVDPIDADPPELDDDGAIVESEAGATTRERPGDGDSVSPAEASEAASKAAETTADGTATADGETPTSGGTTASEATAAGGATTADATDGPESERPANAESGREDGAAASEIADAGEATEAETTTTEAETTATGATEAETTATGATEAETTATGATDDASETADRTEAVAESVADADATDPDDGFADSGFQPASSELERDATDEQLAALTEAVERQNELLAKQQRTLERLVEELRRER